MALTNPYCTVQQVRDYIRNTAVAITGQLEDAINAASRWIDEYKSRDYTEHDYSTTALVLRGHGKDVLGETIFLTHKPVISLTEVKVNDVVWTVDVDFYVNSAAGTLHSLAGNWLENGRSCVNGFLRAFRSPALGKVEIKGRFGYAQRDAAVPPATLGALNTSLVPAGMPSHIQQACIQIAAALSRWNMKDVVGLDGSKTSIMETDLPKSALQLLGPRGKLII